MRLKLHGIFVSLLLTISFLFGSDTSGEFEKLLVNLEKQTYDYVQEKVYLHLDKPYYSLEDDLWFKAYTVAGPNHTPTPLSQNLYVEFINPEGKVLKRLTVYMNKGLGKGDFALDKTLVPGTYTVRAYTNWMRNFDKGFHFIKKVEVVNPFAGNGERRIAGSKDFQMQFFPEGGDLIANVPMQVAFELNSSEEVEGMVVDGNGAEVVRIKTQHEGRGKFRIVPRSDEQYFVVLKDGTRFPLPEVKEQGFGLSVDNFSDKENLVVKLQSSNLAQSHAYLIVHTRGLVSFASKLEWKGGTARVKVPRKDLALGVVHITLFNKDWLPEAERLVFRKDDPGAFKVVLGTDQPVYQPRDSSIVKLKVTDASGSPVHGFFSMSIFDTGQINPEAFESHIESELLLDSDIKGQLNNPAQYFDVKNKQADQQLDLLLMTRGWSRFTWQDLLADEFVVLDHEVEQGFDISGKVTLRGGEKSAPKAKVKQVGFFEGMPIFAEATANSKGEFQLNDLHYYTGNGALKAEDRKGRDNVTVQLDTVLSEALGNTVKLPEEWGLREPKVAMEESYMEGSKERMEIERAYTLDTSYTDLGTVIVEADANQEIFQDMQRGLAFNRGEYGVNASELMAKGQRFVNALYVLQGRLPGFNITLGTSGEPVVQMTRKVWSFSNPDPPIQYYIDDAPVSLAAVTALPAERLERVDVLKGMKATSLFGPSANGGAIMFYTKTSEEQEDYLKRLTENNIVLDRSTISIRSGYYRNREFYAPSYSGELRNQIKPDRRALIHWEPMIETDENGEAIVTYFNADVETTIQVNLEGIWAGGTPLRASTSYKVSK